MNQEEYQKLDPGTRKLVDWQRGRTGAFWTLIFEAMCRADGKNLDALQNAFPEEVSAYRNYAQGTLKDPRWWETLRKRLGLGREGISMKDVAGFVKERVGRVG